MGIKSYEFSALPVVTIHVH